MESSTVGGSVTVASQVLHPTNISKQVDLSTFDQNPHIYMYIYEPHARRVTKCPYFLSNHYICLMFIWYKFKWMFIFPGYPITTFHIAVSMLMVQ